MNKSNLIILVIFFIISITLILIHPFSNEISLDKEVPLHFVIWSVGLILNISLFLVFLVKIVAKKSNEIKI